MRASGSRNLAGPLMLALLCGGLGVMTASTARADDQTHFLSAFAMTRLNEPSARVVEFYGSEQMRWVRQRQQPTCHKPARS